MSKPQRESVSGPMAAADAPRTGQIHRLLVLLDADFEPEELRTAIEVRGIGRKLDLRLVAPTMASSTFHYLTGTEEAERLEASRRLEAAFSPAVT